MENEPSLDDDIMQFLIGKRSELDKLCISVQQKIKSLKGNGRDIDGNQLSMVYEIMLI